MLNAATGRRVLRLRKSLRRLWHLFQPHTALFEMDRVIAEMLPFRHGVFVEVGANDGVAQSNTYFLGRRRGWTGILIEPVPWLARTARRWRPDSVVIEAIATSPQLAGKEVGLLDLDLVSRIDLGSSTLDLSTAPKDVVLAKSSVIASTTTLTHMLEEHNLAKVDFLSVDVEGHEMEVLMGLDLSKYQPRLILVETANIDSIRQLLSTHYRVVSALSHHDYLFQHLSDISESGDVAATTTP